MPAAIFKYTSLLLTLVTLSSAVLVNRTIDDQYGDPITSTYPVYSPIGDWQQGATCSDCAIKPDVSKAFDGTWHDSTFYPESTPKSVSVTFNGSAVYAFFITSPVLTTTTTTQTHLNFTLDNTLIGAYNFIPDASSTYTYNNSVFSKTGLSNGEHTLVMTTGGTTAALLLFDYVIYTTDEAAGATSSSASVGHSSSASSGGSLTSTSPGAVVSSTSPGAASSSKTAAGSSSSKSSGGLSKTTSAKIIAIRIRPRKASRNVTAGSHCVRACVSGADASITSLIHLPMHLKYFISMEGEKNDEKEYLPDSFSPGQGRARAKQQKHPRGKRREHVEEDSKEIDAEKAPALVEANREGDPSQASRWKKRETRAGRCPGRRWRRGEKRLRTRREKRTRGRILLFGARMLDKIDYVRQGPRDLRDRVATLGDPMREPWM